MISCCLIPSRWFFKALSYRERCSRSVCFSNISGKETVPASRVEDPRGFDFNHPAVFCFTANLPGRLGFNCFPGCHTDQHSSPDRFSCGNENTLESGPIYMVAVSVPAKNFAPSLVVCPPNAVPVIREKTSRISRLEHTEFRKEAASRRWNRFSKCTSRCISGSNQGDSMAPLSEECCSCCPSWTST